MSSMSDSQYNSIKNVKQALINNMNNINYIYNTKSNTKNNNNMSGIVQQVIYTTFRLITKI